MLFANFKMLEMFDVDVLLLLQAANCNQQIPAKAYEYIKVEKPILGLTSETGETGKLLSSIPYATVAPLDDADRIATQIIAVLAQESEGAVTQKLNLDQYSRRSGADKLNSLLLSII